jgi:hypothetical protein
MGLVITSASRKYSSGINFASGDSLDSANFEKPGARIWNKFFILAKRYKYGITYMKIATKLSMLFVSSLMLLAAFSPALALTSPIMAPRMSIVNSFNGTVTSTNWSGYAVTGASGSVTSASGLWTVPTVTGSNGQYVAFWVGIDGYNSATVEQTGVLAQVTGNRRTSTTTYYAWYEFYPSESIIEITTATSGGSAIVKPGDTIYATVTYTSGAAKPFTLTLTDETEGWTFTTTGSQSGATESSAEWIVEAPSSNFGVLPLANFGTALFGSDSTGVTRTCYATIAGTSGAIGSFGSLVEQINMVTNRGTLKDSTSKLSTDGTSFSVTWKSSGSGLFGGF